MDLHLYTTDISGLKLVDGLSPDDRFTAVIVPANRSSSDKVAAVREQSNLPVVLHSPGAPLPEGTPCADAIVSWLYSQIIAMELLNVYPFGGINMHGGRIPGFRGANVLNWAIANGEMELGVTWHEMVEKVDAGGILAESTIPIGPDDTANDMRAAMIAEGISTFSDAFKCFRDGNQPVRMPNLEEGHVWPSRRPEHGRIQSGWSRERVWNMIRAQTGPWPDATVMFKGEWCPISAISDVNGAGLITYQLESGGTVFLVPSEQSS